MQHCQMWLFAEKESYMENTLEKGLHLQDKHSILFISLLMKILAGKIIFRKRKDRYGKD